MTMPQNLPQISGAHAGPPTGCLGQSRACPSEFPRRQFLKRSAVGLTAIGGGMYPALSLAARLQGGHALSPQLTHVPAKAKQLIFVFLTGGFSHVDTFDPKPRLLADQGKIYSVKSVGRQHDLPLLPSPFKFKPSGRSGLMISELFTHLQGVADELCVIRSLHSDIIEHFQATLAMHTGSATVPMPSLGSWLSYGLGTLNPNLPAYMVLAERMPYAGAQVWDSNFLPPLHQGVRITPGDNPIPNLHSTVRSATLQELEQVMLRDLNEMHAAGRPSDIGLRARINTFQTARGMMREAPEVLNTSQETAETHQLYGLKAGDRSSFAWQCLVARRLIERGVRVVELIDTGADNNWDAHGNPQEHRPKAARVDKPLAGLIADLKRRGMLDQTLIVCCTEFGRTPWAQEPKSKGRNHWCKAFSCLLCGGGVKGGLAYGETDEFGATPAHNPVHLHDYHATILHLLGIDHKRLTYRYAGRDFRLTDVHGNVVHYIIA